MGEGWSSDCLGWVDRTALYQTDLTENGQSFHQLLSLLF